MEPNQLFERSLWEEFYQDFVRECKKLYENKGFTYDIPCEEQIRSALYSFLRKKEYLIELESDLFKKGEDEKKVVGMYDLRVINKDFDLLVEIKRTWGLNGWMNKYKEFFDSWNKDIAKLKMLEEEEYESENINSNRKKCFMLMTFSDNNSFYDHLKEKINEFNESLKEWEFIEFEKQNLNDTIFCNLFVWIEK